MLVGRRTRGINSKEIAMLARIPNQPIPPVMVQLFDGDIFTQYNVVSRRGQDEVIRLITRLADEARTELPLAA